MEIKKTPKADLENKRFIFFEIGLILVLLCLYFAFEWTSGETEITSFDQQIVETVDAEQIPVTRQEDISATPPPPPPPMIQVVTELDIVDNSTDIKNELNLESSESDEKKVVDIVEMPEQVGEPEEAEEQIFFIVEEMPEYPGGEQALRQFIADHIEYPEIARENEISGRVYVQFIINENGEVKDAKVVRGVDPSRDKAALKVINSFPKWKPGKQRDKPVKCAYVIPISFVLSK